MRRHFPTIILVAAAAMLAVLAAYFTVGVAAAVQTLFYLALLGLVIGVLRIIIPPR